MRQSAELKLRPLADEEPDGPLAKHMSTAYVLSFVVPQVASIKEGSFVRRRKRRKRKKKPSFVYFVRTIGENRPPKKIPF